MNKVNHSTSVHSSTESRALTLLGSGLGPETVAQATGVSVSRISQLLSDPEFAAQVATLRFNNLQKHNVRDDTYDSIEDTLIERMKDLVPMMYKPMEVLRAIAVINNAKRRGASAPTEVHNHSSIVNISMPKVLIEKFVVNANNQVISTGAGESIQDLVTVQSGAMNGMLARAKLLASPSNTTEPISAKDL